MSVQKQPPLRLTLYDSRYHVNPLTFQHHVFTHAGSSYTYRRNGVLYHEPSCFKPLTGNLQRLKIIPPRGNARVHAYKLPEYNLLKGLILRHKLINEG